MNCFATDRQGRHRASCAANRARCACLLLCVLATASCSNDRLTAEQARQLIESSERFAAPELMTVRQQYCATVDAPDGNVSVGTSRLKALEAAGAIRVERRAAAPGECGSLPGPMRERLMVSLADGGASFHPRRLDNGDWEFRLARRRFRSIGEITFNGEGERKLAHAIYSWSWTAELLGQLLQVSEEPVNAQASFVWRDGAWMIRDVGF